MTLYDIYDAWTYELEDSERDSMTREELLKDLEDYTDACSFRNGWDCAPLSDEEEKLIVDCYIRGGAGAYALKDHYHPRTYKIEVRYLDGGWTEWRTMYETVDATSAEEAREKLSEDYIRSISSYEDEYGDAVPYDETAIRISPRSDVMTDGKDCSFFVLDRIK